MANKKPTPWTDQELEIRYTTGKKITLRALAQESGHPFNYVSGLCSSRGWVELRKTRNGATSKLAADKIMAQESDRLATMVAVFRDFQADALEECIDTLQAVSLSRQLYASGGVKHINGFGNEVESPPWGPKQYRDHASAVDSVVKTARLIMGESTEITESLDDELKARNPELFEGLGSAL